jgi:hypothetical protein
VTQDDYINSETLAILDASTCTPKMLADARQDAIARRLDGAARAISDDFPDAIEAYIKFGYPAGVAERVCSESALSGYWTARRLLGNVDESYEWSADEQQQISELVSEIAIEDVVIRGVAINDEIALLRGITGAAENDDMSYPMIDFDTGFTAAVVEYDAVISR